MPSRCVALVLASEADNATGKITASLSVIAAGTGASRSTVAKHLITLEKSGFLSRRAPTSWQSLGRGEMTEYTLLIPPGHQTRSGPTIGRPSAPRGLPSPGDGLGVVRKNDIPSPGDGHITTDLTAAAPRTAGAVAGTDRELPASSPDEEVTAPRQYHCISCGIEASLAAISLGKECKCGHTHTHEEHFSEEIAS
ncbi:helix-turn-helix domain-containing protein [Janibacter hoylei]|uniref:helix-turn-helix domain-containing protein n=1 Tax=Janibacter hoylei TaxID=364298 RepID=UPI0035CD0DB7